MEGDESSEDIALPEGFMDAVHDVKTIEEMHDTLAAHRAEILEGSRRQSTFYLSILGPPKLRLS